MIDATISTNSSLASLVFSRILKGGGQRKTILNLREASRGSDLPMIDHPREYWRNRSLRRPSPLIRLMTRSQMKSNASSFSSYIPASLLSFEPSITVQTIQYRNDQRNRRETLTFSCFVAGKVYTRCFSMPQIGWFATSHGSRWNARCLYQFYGGS